mmetsp:Transcript_7768/g.24916  ORF Transcript_7768/g.24916 Transcript_7768/m.24916 type:complete len:137 (-) Transcript_7768:2124-2534(-)
MYVFDEPDSCDDSASFADPEHFNTSLRPSDVKWVPVENNPVVRLDLDEDFATKVGLAEVRSIQRNVGRYLKSKTRGPSCSNISESDVFMLCFGPTSSFATELQDVLELEDNEGLLKVVLSVVKLGLLWAHGPRVAG